MSSLAERARTVADYAYDLEEGLREAGHSPDDSIHHPGDDTGKLMWEGYVANGPAGAVEVLDAYTAEFNARRTAKGQPTLDPTDLAVTLGWAVSVKASTEQIAEIRAEYCHQHGITDPAPR